MERLTQKNNGVWEVKFRTADGTFVPTQQVIDRLAAYEDTGLEPEEIIGRLAKQKVEDIFTAETKKALDKLMEYKTAEKEGRLLVPPCKVGDTVYLPGKNDWGDTLCFEVIETGTDRNAPYFVIDDEECEHIPMKDIGKTVFLTREEAEAALEKEVEGSE